MPALIRFRKPELQAKHGDIPWADHSTLMEALLAAGIPVASSCGGDGVCTKCRLHVRMLSNHPAPPVEALEGTLLKKISAEKSERISCQVTLVSLSYQKTLNDVLDKGPGADPLVIEVDAPYW